MRAASAVASRSLSQVGVSPSTPSKPPTTVIAVKVPASIAMTMVSAGQGALLSTSGVKQGHHISVPSGVQVIPAMVAAVPAAASQVSVLWECLYSEEVSQPVLEPEM